MKKDIHPKYADATIICACGEVIQTRSTKKEIKVGVCSKCHPFFTGTQKYLDTAGRVEKFMKKYAGVKIAKKKIRTRAGETTVPAVEAGARPVAAEGAAEPPAREAPPAPEGAPPAAGQPPAGPAEGGAPQAAPGAEPAE
ncbi:MAG: 50S ribosomal protein L31 [Candidatus Aureabacteria bacterium]|nr:50S ribosomal protein L31 [Candidatus Auribacterota bacterium]